MQNCSYVLENCKIIDCLLYNKIYNLCVIYFTLFLLLKKTPMKSHKCLSEQKLISLRKLPIEHIFLYL